MRSKFSHVKARVSAKVGLARTRAVRRLRLDPPMPETVFIAVNSVCNLRCEMCDVGQRQADSSFYQNLVAGGDLPVDRLLELVEEAKTYEPLMHVISTEPLLYGGLEDFLRHAERYGIPTAITTNGLLLKREARTLVEGGLRDLWVSLDGPPAIHDVIRGFAGSFERAIAGIEEVRRLASPSEKPIVRVSYTVTDRNFDQLVPFLKTLSSVPVAAVTFSHLNFVTDDMAAMHNACCSDVCLASATSLSAVNLQAVDAEQLWTQTQEVLGTEWPFQVGFVPYLESAEDVRLYYRDPPRCVGSDGVCLVPWRSVQVLSSGDVVPLTRCFHLVLGNIHQSSLRDIWYGEAYKRFRQQLATGGHFPACTRCCGLF